MRLFLLFLISVFVVLTGCTNPTHTYHPLDLPDRSKGEIVKYESVKINVKSRNNFAYEAKTADSVTLFTAKHFCYDPSNDYIVVPLKADDEFTYSPKDGLFVAIPKDSVTLCKDGVKNNSYFSRNHPLHGATIGGVIVGSLFGLGAMAMSPLFLFMSNGSFNAGLFILISTGIGASIGSAIGVTADAAMNSEKLIEDIQETCSAYYNEADLKNFLEKNLCY